MERHGMVHQCHRCAVMVTVTVSVCNTQNCVATVLCHMHLLYAILACSGVIAFGILAVMTCDDHQ